MTYVPIASVGAGVTGLAAARKLPPSSYQIFEKSRGPGGRLASKRIEKQRADIGAQFFTVRDPRFKAVVELAHTAGAVQSWEPRVGTFRSSIPVDSPDTQQRYVGAPYMNALGRFLSQSVMIESQTRIDTIRRNGSYFVLTTATGTEYSAEQVLVTTPVDQMADLLAQFEIAPIVRQFTMEPTWTTVVSSGYQLTTSTHEPIDACFGGDHGVSISFQLSAASRDVVRISLSCRHRQSGRGFTWSAILIGSLRRLLRNSPTRLVLRWNQFYLIAGDTRGPRIRR